MRKTKNSRVVIGERSVKWRRMGFNGVMSEALTVSQVDLSVGGHVTTAEAGEAADGEALLMRGCWGSGEEVDVLMLNRKTLFIEVH